MLYKDENTGGIRRRDRSVEPGHRLRRAVGSAAGPVGERAHGAARAAASSSRPTAARTWQPADQRACRRRRRRRRNIAIAPSNPKRICTRRSPSGADRRGIYRSDDAGENWTQRPRTTRAPPARIGGGDLPVPAVDPKNPDIVYIASIVTWKSTDGGKTWTGIRGAPGGDDYQHIWINPEQPEHHAASSSDQGAIVTVNGGETWSSWYNQPTAQMYHVAADNAFPYRVCSGQQESGSACVASRGNDGADHVPRVASGRRRGVRLRRARSARSRHRLRRQADALRPAHRPGAERRARSRCAAADFRVLRTAPVVFSPVDPHMLYFAGEHAVEDRRRRAAAGSRSAPT